MIQWIFTHPFVVTAILWAIALSLMLFLCWKRGSMRTRDERATTDDIMVDHVVEWAKLIREGMVKRLSMRPRYVPKPQPNQLHSDMKAAQILADQQTAHEQPGEVTHAPAPGERNYRQPSSTVRLTVGNWTIYLQRGEPLMVCEARPGGANVPAYPVPDHWSELISEMAFEIARLREGWSVQ